MNPRRKRISPAASVRSERPAERRLFDKDSFFAFTWGASP